MATVFMKWLETRPAQYERGIRLLTLGRLQRIRRWIVEAKVRPGMHVLEIGCGTGALSAMMATRGASVTGIDISPAMLGIAERRIAARELTGQVHLKHITAAQIADSFPPHSFDLIVSTLVFSELPDAERRYVLESCRELLVEGGSLVIADEIRPDRLPARLLYELVRLPLALGTWLLTRATTNALQGFDRLLEQAGFRARRAATLLAGTLVIYEAEPAPEGLARAAAQAEAPFELPSGVAGRLQQRVTLRTLLLDLWLLFFRIIPPYPKVCPGLYAVGRPDRRSPVLVTGNFELTVRRLVRAIDGAVDAWVLVADSAGINVWCAAGGGYFTADKVIGALKASPLERVVDHHALILPQLCANGVDGWRIRHETGWGVHWGPARARDIPAYLAARRKKTDAMRWVRFPLPARLEMVTVTLGFYALLILLPVWIFWRPHFWPVTFSLLGLSYFYAVVHPWLPGQDGLYKSIPLAMLALAGLVVYSAAVQPLPRLAFFHWAVGLTGLSVFSAAELQGMSPLMRGEQANWIWEGVLAVCLVLVYAVVPRLLGWTA